VLWYTIACTLPFFRYRRPPTDLLANAAAVGLGGRGAVLVYVSADAAQGGQADGGGISGERGGGGGGVRGCQMGRTTPGGSSTSASLTLTLDDFTPFFRRPLFLIIDGPAGQGFCSALKSPEKRRFGHSALVLTPLQGDCALVAHGYTKGLLSSATESTFCSFLA
jgi:hypothetical protein